ncbi:MAG: tetratricopeptide repeat protein [Phycisphaerales bacterium]
MLLAEPDRGNYYRPMPSGRTDALARLIVFHRAVVNDEMSLVSTLLLQVESAAAEVRFKVRVAAAQQAAEILQRRFGPNHFAVLVCVQDAAVTSLYDGQIPQALELTGRSCQIWDTVPAPARDNLLAANSHRYRAWALNVAKKYPEAEVEARTAAVLFESAAGPRHHTIAVCRAFAAFALAEQGKLDEARAESKAALDMALASPTSPSDLIAVVRFVRGHVSRTRRATKPRPSINSAAHGSSFSATSQPTSRGSLSCGPTPPPPAGASAMSRAPCAGRPCSRCSPRSKNNAQPRPPLAGRSTSSTTAVDSTGKSTRSLCST